MSENNIACWRIELNAVCPQCEHYWSILEQDWDFWESGIAIAEHGTDLTKDFPVNCPKCGYEFLVDFDY